MLSFDPYSIPTKDLHQFMVSAVAPRPIAWVSTVDAAGNANLAPYSFFNAFSSNPPIVVFSSNRRVSDGTTKDTLHNIEATMECVINMVSYDVVRQMAVTGVEFPHDVNEFEKAGVTPLASVVVKPFRVQEAPVQMECKVSQIIPLGDKGGAGHLIICNIVHFHINKAVLDESGRIDAQKIDLMGRLGRTFYNRTSQGLMSIMQSQTDMVIGYDALPNVIKESHVFTGNNLGQLAGLQALPDHETLNALRMSDARVQKILFTSQSKRQDLQQYAKEALDSNNSILGAQLAMLSVEIG
jgi:flavin reductase (DIM6/NTAB) family NADH-FMN oxidoreductase RutF